MTREAEKEMDEISDKIYGSVASNVQSAQIYHMRKYEPDPFAATAIGSSAALGALTLNAMVFAKRDPKIYSEKTKDESSEDQIRELAWKLVCNETVIFAGLVAAHARADSSAETLDFAYGPAVFWEAVSDWQKIFPDKKIDDYIDPALLMAARNAGTDSDKPFDEFLKGRLIARSSGSLN